MVSTSFSARASSVRLALIWRINGGRPAMSRVSSNDLLRDILTTYLNRKAADLRWLADLLDRANTQLGDPDLAIGPSHFMSPGLTEVRARRAWNHSVLPTLREYFHSNTARLEAFDFDTLKTQLNLPDDTDTAAD